MEERIARLEAMAQGRLGAAVSYQAVR
jgi:hypothetical protein